MKHVVSISGGAGSTLAAERVINRYGPLSVELVFADTNSEHKSLYDLLRFMKDRHPLATFVYLGNGGRTVWDVFDYHSAIRTPSGSCKASLVLKYEAIARYMHAHHVPGEAILFSGLDYAEGRPARPGSPSRQERWNARWLPYESAHPLNWKPHLVPCEVISQVEKLGYPRQDLYERRYRHNNCGGGCVLAGLGQWHRLYLEDPALFAWHEERERAFIERQEEKGMPPFTILRDQKSKATAHPDGTITYSHKATPLPLGVFRERIDRNDQSLKFVEFRSICGCMKAEQGNLFEELGICF